MTAQIRHRTVTANGIQMHVAEAGEGPLVVLCHGWPESWYSWRHQLVALAEAGYRAVAPDQRGYGQTDKPEAVEAYTGFHLVGDIVGLVHALGEERAVIAGHDWGALVAWQAALWRPDLFRGAIVLSVPTGPRLPIRPTALMKQAFADRFFYILYFQEPGKAEAELERDVRKTLRMLLYTASGDGPDVGFADAPKSARFLDQMVEPETLPAWLSEADLDFFTAEFERSGFRGPLNWYRNFDRTWELAAPFQGKQIRIPALFISGDRDLIRANPEFETAMRAVVPDVQVRILPGIGHWTQQEAPEAVNAAMLEFLKGLGD